jgi:hypothetical protein
MELTLTQKIALFRTHRRISKKRTAFFRGLGLKAALEHPDVRRQALAGAEVYGQFHRDSGR